MEDVLSTHEEIIDSVFGFNLDNYMRFIDVTWQSVNVQGELIRTVI